MNTTLLVQLVSRDGCCEKKKKYTNVWEYGSFKAAKQAVMDKIRTCMKSYEISKDEYSRRIADGWDCGTFGHRCYSMRQEELDCRCKFEEKYGKFDGRGLDLPERDAVLRQWKVVEFACPMPYRMKQEQLSETTSKEQGK